MKLEDIEQAFRLLAMGRANHPLQVELAEALAKVLAPAGAKPFNPDAVYEVTPRHEWAVTLPDVPSIVTPDGLNIPGAVNAPKRRKKAD